MKSNRIFIFGFVSVVVISFLWFVSNFVNTSLFQMTTSSYDSVESFGVAKDVAAPSGMPSRMIGGVPAQVTAPSAPSDGVMRKEIKTGSLSLVVEDVPLSVEKITGFAKTQEGYVVSTYMSKASRFPTASLSLRVPAERFDASMSELKKFGELEQAQVQGQDVTEEYVDLEARLKNLRVTEAQFAEIMKKAQKIEDILAVQAQLSQVRGEIESLEGRKKYLDQNVAYSVISVNLSTSADQLPIVDEGEKWKPLAVLKMAVRGLLDVGKGLVNVTIWFVVFAPVWGILFGLGYYLKKKFVK
jgi:hypothetical protein